MQFSKVTIALLAACTFVAAQEPPADAIDVPDANTTETDVIGETTGELPDATATGAEGEEVAAGEEAAAGDDAAIGSGETTVHVITVGNAAGEPVFEPKTLKAAVGDMVQFQFYPSNHSVVMSAFDRPCAPADGDDAFYSGYMPVRMEDTEMPLYTIPITDDTKPIWFYCSQGQHCQNGMVGVINQQDGQEEKTIEKYAEACASAEENVTPGAPPSGGEEGSTEGGDSAEDPATTLSTATATAGGAEATASESTVAPGTNSATRLATSTAAIFLAALASTLLF